jgi:hypothetical protein
MKSVSPFAFVVASTLAAFACGTSWEATAASDGGVELRDAGPVNGDSGAILTDSGLRDAGDGGFIADGGDGGALPPAGLFARGGAYWGAVGHWNGNDGAGQYAGKSDAQVIADLKDIFGSTPNTIVYRAFGLEAPGLNTPSSFASVIANYIGGGIIPLALTYTYPKYANYSSEAAAYTEAYKHTTDALAALPAGTKMVIEVFNEASRGDLPLAVQMHNVTGGDGHLASQWKDPGVTYYPIARGIQAGVVAAVRDHMPTIAVVGGGAAGWTGYGLALALAGDLTSYTPPGAATPRNLVWDYTAHHHYQDAGSCPNCQGATLSTGTANGGVNYFTALKGAFRWR